MFVFAAALVWLGAGPVIVLRWAARRAASLGWLVPLATLAAMLSLALLWMAVPTESLDDIIGAPDLYRRITAELYWGPAWAESLRAVPPGVVQTLERVVRYVALYAILMLPLMMAMLAIGSPHNGSPLRRMTGIAWLTLWWWVARLVVVEAAVTDNLTELIADGGVPWLAALLMLFASNTAGLASLRWKPLSAFAWLVFTAAALALGWWLLVRGLEQVIVKYDAVWSAQQFLLGRNRTQRLPESALFLRWSGLYLSMLCLCALGARLARRPTSGPSVDRVHHAA
jgi:hypothetical protein